MALNNSPLVWVVDDVASVRQALTAILEAGGFCVRAYDGAAAFLADAGRGEKGWLVVDQQMPEMTGTELLEQLGRRNALPPAVLISAGMTPALLRQATLAGARATMAKPVDGEELIALLRRISS